MPYISSQGCYWWPVKRYHVEVMSAHHTDHMEFQDFTVAYGYGRSMLGCYNNCNPNYTSSQYVQFQVTDRKIGTVVLTCTLNEKLAEDAALQREVQEVALIDVVAIVAINGHTYENVVLSPVRSDDDYSFWENMSYKASCVVNGEIWHVERRSGVYEGTYMERALPSDAPLAQESVKECVCCRQDRPSTIPKSFKYTPRSWSI